MKTDEKNPIFDIRDTLEKYACIYRNTTLKLFQYCQETDIYERLDEYLRPVKNITDFKIEAGNLIDSRQKYEKEKVLFAITLCSVQVIIYPENVSNM